MPSRTIFLSKLIGLSCVLISLSMLTNKAAFVGTLTALVRSAPLLFLTGGLTVTAGLAIILAHSIWSGGALPVVVSLVGWAALIKGLLVLFLSPEVEFELFFGTLHYERLFYLFGAIPLLLGAYLTYAGYTSTARR